MQFEPKLLEDGSLAIKITASPEEMAKMINARQMWGVLSFGKNDYCVS